MRDLIRVLVLGTGQMGSAIARLLLQKQGLQLVGAYARRAERAGLDVGRAIGLNRDLGLPVYVDLPSLIRDTEPDLAIQATCSKLIDARDEISVLANHSVSVISIAEEMAYPAAKFPEFTEKLHRLALANGVSVLGTGINPGFVLDLLVIALTGVCADIQSIFARRVNDLSPYGPSVLKSQGVGLSIDEFEQGVKTGAVAGHFGFDESIHMIAAAMGWTIDRIEQTREPIVSRVKRETPFVRVEKGQVAGCLHSATAYRRDHPVIRLVHPQQIHPHLEGIETGDRIEITGKPNLCLSGSPEIPGGEGTAALAVNMIPRVLNAPPGLYSMADLPVPAALLGDARRFIH